MGKKFESIDRFWVVGGLQLLALFKHLFKGTHFSGADDVVLLGFLQVVLKLLLHRRGFQQVL